MKTPPCHNCDRDWIKTMDGPEYIGTSKCKYCENVFCGECEDNHECLVEWEDK